jgi:hypothetical protein
MQPDSRPESALDVKSSTHALKQLSTRLPKTWGDGRMLISATSGLSWVVGGRVGWGEEWKEKRKEKGRLDIRS